MHTGCKIIDITDKSVIEEEKMVKLEEKVLEVEHIKVDACLDPAATNFQYSCSGVKISKQTLEENPEAYVYNLECCKYDEVIISEFTDITKLSSLSAGLTKVQVLALLDGMYPYEIYQSNESCEIHSYLYREINREFEYELVTSESSLTSGIPVYGTGDDQEYNAYIIYRNGKLENVVTEETNIKSLVCFEDVCSTDENFIICMVRGCMDEKASNYNPEANMDDGSCDYPIILGCTDPQATNYNPEANEDNKNANDCDYCPCDYKKNPDYNSERDCGEKCIPEFKFVDGCMDPNAANYNSDATRDDGSCVQCPCATDDYYYAVDDNPNCVGDPCIKVMRTKEVKEIAEKDCNLCDILDVSGNIKLEISGTTEGKIKK